MPIDMVATELARPSARLPRLQNPMQLTIAAVLAVVTALAEFGAAHYLQIGVALLHPVLVLGVVWSAAGTVEAGLAWCFTGGLALDIVSQRPLGSTAFSLLIAVRVGAVAAARLGALRLLAPIVAVAIASPLFTVLTLVTTALLTSAPLDASAFGVVIPSLIYDLVVAAVIGPLVMSIVLRRREVERIR
jgi:rod shape-determining protein MreD